VRRFPFVVLLFASVAACGQSAARHAETPASAPTPVLSDASAGSGEVMAAEAAIAKSDWKTAESKLAPWITAHPNDARALFDSGYVAGAQNRLDEAATLYRRAIDLNPQSFAVHVELGLVLARQGKLTEARTELAAATRLDPGEAGPSAKARAWRALAEMDRAEHPVQASEELLEALKLSPETPDDTLLAASLAEQSGQFDAAEMAYRRLLASNPNYAPANAGLAHLMIVRKQYPQAETLLRKALEQSPDDPALTAQLAAVLAAQDKAEALPLMQKLHGAHPGDPAITRMLAEVLAEAGDAASSDQLYVALLASSPENPELLVAHGQNLIRQLKYAAAFAAFDKATQLDPANADGWSGLAYAASETGRPTVTIHALTMRSRVLPEIPSTYFLWATAYDTLHNKAEAVAYYHHFLTSSAGKFPHQESQTRQRLLILEGKK
jgi:predicted Zn-dependent protease